MANDLDALATRLLAAADSASLLPLPSQADPAFDLDAAYRVADRVRALQIARGRVPRGYKIGFTNRRLWPLYGVQAPIWGVVWQHSLQLLDGTDARLSLGAFAQPRLEPEIVFGLRAAPLPGATADELAGCIDWVAHGVEVVQTHFADWRFTAPDTVADGGLHGRLLVGPRVALADFGDAEQLRTLRLQLLRDDQPVDAGDGRAVLDGPLDALRHFVAALAAGPAAWPLRAGDVVTTGTLTDAWPLQPGQRWRTRFDDERLPGLQLTTEP